MWRNEDNSEKRNKGRTVENINIKGQWDETNGQKCKKGNQ